MVNNIPIQLSNDTVNVFDNHETGSAIQGIMIKNIGSSDTSVKFDILDTSNNIDFEMFSVDVTASETLFVKHPLYITPQNTIRVTTDGEINILFSYLVDKGVGII